jgi:hypothetical protein
LRENNNLDPNYLQGDIGGACGLDCASLLDDDITDDYKCAKRIYRAHEGLQGNGFKAWAVYAPYCSAGREALEALYTADCFTETAAVQRLAVVPAVPYSWWFYHVITP